MSPPPTVPPPRRSDEQTALLADERRLLQQAAQLRPPTAVELARGWRRLAEAQASSGRKTPRWSATVLVPASALAALLSVVWLRPTLLAPARPAPAGSALSEPVTPLPALPDLPAPPALPQAAAWTEQTLGAPDRPSASLRVRPGSTVRVASDARVELEAGAICAEVAHRDPRVLEPLVVAAPRVDVFVVGTRFCVEVQPDADQVTVQEGRVRVRARSGAIASVGAGEALRSNALVEPPPARRCAGSGRERCLESSAAGDGLAAQNALFALALAARDEHHDSRAAAAHFGRYLERFPDGPLAPEASLDAMAELRQVGDDAAAAAEAARYLKRYATGGRAGEVGLFRANELRERLGQPEEALAQYARVTASEARPALREEGLYGQALSLLDLGRRPEARRALQRLQEEFPAGPHAARAAALLAPLDPGDAQ